MGCAEGMASAQLGVPAQGLSAVRKHTAQLGEREKAHGVLERHSSQDPWQRDLVGFGNISVGKVAVWGLCGPVKVFLEQVFAM